MPKLIVSFSKIPIFTAFPFLHNFWEAYFSSGHSRLYLIIRRYVIYSRRIRSLSWKRPYGKATNLSVL